MGFLIREVLLVAYKCTCIVIVHVHVHVLHMYCICNIVIIIINIKKQIHINLFSPFLLGCLIELVKESNIRCPKCHHNTPISSHGVTMTLVKNYGVLEIIYSHPSSYRTNAVSTNDVCVTDLALCDVHGDRLTSFCVKDKVLVCSSCLLYGEHKDHPCQLVKDAGIEYRQRLRRLIPDLLDRNDKTKGVIVDVKRMINRVQDSSEVLGTQVDVYFDRLLRVLEERKLELKLEILHRTQERVEALSEQAW